MTSQFPVVPIVLVGVGATALLDAFTVLRTRIMGARAPDYALLGRWIAHFGRGRLRHDAIAEAAPMRFERAIGWSAHYLIGIAFAAALAAWRGIAWFDRPTPGPALAVGLITVLAPWLVMQPCYGAGIAARRMPRPGAVRRQNLVTHAVFGVSLYLAASLLSLLRA